MATRIFTHGDGDGLCAGALALAANPGAEVFFTHPFGLLGDLGNAEEGDFVVICDISLPEHELSAVLDRFSELAEGGRLVYIDHHPLPEGLSIGDIPGEAIHDTRSSASELAYGLFRDGLGGPLGRLAIYGAIADYLDGTPMMAKLLCDWDKRAIYFETGVLVQGIEGRKRDYDFKRSVVRHLAANDPPSAHPELLRSALENAAREEGAIRSIGKRVRVEGEVAYVIDFPFSLGKAAIYARASAGAAVGIAGERRKGSIDMSLRTCRGDIDLNRILRRIAPGLGGSGGGHPSAAGARIPEGRFREFIEGLNAALAGPP
jgi:RecJ-like exonuclease